MMNLQSYVLASKKDPRFQTKPQELVQSRANVRLALRLEQVVKSAHLRPVIGALSYLGRPTAAGLAIPGVTVPERGEDRPDAPRIIQILRLTLMRARNLGPRGNIGKADAALLQAVGCYGAEERIQLAEARQENAVGCELHRHGVDLADYRRVADRQWSPGIRACGTTNGHLCLVGCVDYAVLQLEGGQPGSSKRPGYRIADLERASWGLHNYPRASRAGRSRSNRESRTRDWRTVKQR